MDQILIEKINLKLWMILSTYYKSYNVRLGIVLFFSLKIHVNSLKKTFNISSGELQDHSENIFLKTENIPYISIILIILKSKTILSKKNENL